MRDNMRYERNISSQRRRHDDDELEPLSDLPPADRTLTQGERSDPQLALPPAEHGGSGSLFGGKGKFILIGIVVLLLLAFLIGYLPRHSRNKKIQEEAERKKNTPPTTEVVQAKRSSPDDRLELPGTLNAYVEA